MIKDYKGGTLEIETVDTVKDVIIDNAGYICPHTGDKIALVDA